MTRIFKQQVELTLFQTRMVDGKVRGGMKMGEAVRDVVPYLKNVTIYEFQRTLDGRLIVVYESFA